MSEDGGLQSLYRQLLPLAVGAPGLGLEDEKSAGTKVAIHSVEEASETDVTPIQVNPLSDTQTQNDIKLLTLTL